MHLSRFRGWIVLAADAADRFTCNFFLFLPALLRSDIQLLNLVPISVFSPSAYWCSNSPSRPMRACGAMRRAGEYLVLLMGMSCGYGSTRWPTLP